MRILYAASKRKAAAGQLNRFLIAAEGLNHTIKIAAYQNLPCVRYVDWNLDSLLDMFNSERISFENDNLETYFNQVKYFNPDVIISDLEIFTSHIATLLNVPVFQIGPRLLYEGLAHKYDLGLSKQYSYVLNQESDYRQRMRHMIDTADCNLVYSHLCDLADPPLLKGGFEYVRPYHVLGKVSAPCQHEMVAVSSRNDRTLLQFLRSNQDSVLFTDFLQETYKGIVLKDLANLDEYACNLHNCTYFVNRGIAEHLADAFYNRKFSWIFPDFTDHESIINSIIMQHFGLGRVLYDLAKPIPVELPPPFYNVETKFLHERLHEF